MQDIDITPDQRKILIDLLNDYLPDVTVWVYGSRIKGTARPQSDLDLAVFASAEQKRAVAALKEALEESQLPFRVDLFVWNEIPQQFRDNIQQAHVVLVNAHSS
ncbi:nucleotidyltransferase domain-containing protein [Nitrosomonas sp. Is24]|uniref:nucleotidyltransferase family protein n=1 Tax=Nitrosomonas sp. Is24 TaxID=3080533 RepID=UPI00294B174D|nr:nucleotidyltransferase domain-containing protein [Nitrosomonas sp. Is24]MDV6342873.1 nucleotidyltransferase domain-containing protein [Nitrosomonas sp. Is24]